GQGHRDYQAKAPLLKIQIKELKNKLTIAPSTPAASTATVVKPISNALARQENQIRRELIALESELATLKDNAKASGQGHRDYQAKAPLLKIQIKELKNKLI
ncbi:hypothetical protein, partial [Vibrio aestuarianus]|uniref:hypothetical protein n=1 Tax=Vibrio aestuarianus TaxID=28171 RepID=UPI00237D26CA